MNRPPEDVEAGRRRSKHQGIAYQGAFEAVFAILIATGIGIWVDGRYDTSPYGLSGGLFVGFGSFVVRLVRLGGRLRDLPQDGEADRMEDEKL